MDDTFDLPKLTLVYVTDLVLAALWICQVMKERVITIRRTQLDNPILLFMCLSVVSAWFSLEPKLSFFGAYQIYVFGVIPMAAFALLYWLTAQAASEALIVWIKRGCLLSAAIVGVYACLQYSGNEIFERMPVIKGGRVWASLGNPLYLGALCMMAWLVGFAEWIHEQSPNRWWVAVAMLPIGSGLILSLSRSAWLGAGIGMGLIALRSFNREGAAFKKKRVVVGLVVIVLSLVIAGVFLPDFKQRAGILVSRGDLSTLARIEGWKVGFNIWRNHPVLGTGPDTFALAFRPWRTLDYVKAAGFGVAQGDAHNDFVQIAATEGLVGVLALLWGYVVFLRKGWQTKDIAYLGLAAGIPALMVQNQFNFSSVSTCAWAAAWAAVVMAQGSDGQPAASYRLQFKTPAMAKVCGWTGLLLIGLAFWAVFIPVRADAVFKRGLALALQNRKVQATDDFRRAIELNGEVSAYENELVNTDKALAQIIPDGATRRALFDEAWAGAQSLTRKHPFSPDAWNNQGVVAMWLTQLENVNHMEEARQAFERAIQLDPIFIDSWADLAKWEHLAGHLEKEKEIWQKVIQLDNKYPMARQVLGLQ